jgi:hypothetical protein
MANDDRAKEQAEARFKPAPAKQNKGGLADDRAAAQAMRDKTARLRALRLAKEEVDRIGADTEVAAAAGSKGGHG